MKRLLILIFCLLMSASVEAAANLKVTAFACNPGEIVANNQFSCTATIQNAGDATGTVNTATLYPDTGNWLEKTNYAETVNSNINSGASVEVVFSNLKGKKSGYNGFSKIMIDDVTDTYVADNGIKVNVVDIIGTADSSGSAASGATVDVTGRAIAGGNVDILLAFSASGCSIGDQASSSTTTDMSNGQTTSHTWTVTMGTENCVYVVSAKATSNPSGAATKTDTTSGSIACSDCASTTTTTLGGGGGGGGGGSSGTTTTIASAKAADATTTTLASGTTTTTVLVTTTTTKESELFGITVSREDYSWMLATIIILAAVAIAGYMYYHYEHARKLLSPASKKLCDKPAQVLKMQKKIFDDLKKKKRTNVRKDNSVKKPY